MLRLPCDAVLDPAEWRRSMSPFAAGPPVIPPPLPASLGWLPPPAAISVVIDGPLGPQALWIGLQLTRPRLGMHLASDLHAHSASWTIIV